MVQEHKGRALVNNENVTTRVATPKKRVRLLRNLFFRANPARSGPTSHYNMSGEQVRILYAQSYAQITLPGSEAGLQEKLIRIMEITETVDYDERLAGIENRLRNMDALVRGLIAEMLDLKTVTMATAHKEGEYTRQELVRGTSSQAPADSRATAEDSSETVVILPKAAPQAGTAAEAEPEMVRIMQADGTMKLEPRYGDKNTTSNSAGYGRSTKRSSALSRQESLR